MKFTEKAGLITDKIKKFMSRRKLQLNNDHILFGLKNYTLLNKNQWKKANKSLCNLEKMKGIHGKSLKNDVQVLMVLKLNLIYHLSVKVIALSNIFKDWKMKEPRNDERN